VLRSLRVLDGAVCILDGVAGVEAQTEKVWTQADQYQIPRIVYVNKLDRVGAAFGRTVKEVGLRLRAWPAVCQIPWWNPTGSPGAALKGVGDAVNLRGLLWEHGSDGRSVTPYSLAELKKVDEAFSEELKNARVALIELLSEHDDEMVERYLEFDEDHLAIPSADVLNSLRRCTLRNPQRVFPVFCGASFRNIGVQPLLDAVVDLLPSPAERPSSEIQIAGAQSDLKSLISGETAHIFGTSAVIEQNVVKKVVAKSKAMVQNVQSCILAFKVTNDPKRGVLVYIRVYSGVLERNALLYNTNLDISEKAPRLLKMYANDATEVNSIREGQIGVIVGLKYTRTGDTLISYLGMNPKHGPPAPLNSLQLKPIVVPPPVFFTSVEPNSLSEEKHVNESLSVLLREDPSLNVSIDVESGQTHLAGMGELHLEIARDRLLNDFKAKALIGDIEIGYRETIGTASGTHKEHVIREVAGKSSQATSVASVRPIDVELSTGSPIQETSYTILELETNRIVIRHPHLSSLGEPLEDDAPSLPVMLPWSSIIAALKTGVAAALSRGPVYHYPVSNVEITLDFDQSSQLFPETTTASLVAAARQATRSALRTAAENGGASLMEPVMLVSITVNEGDIGNVIHDLSSARGGQVLELDSDSFTSLSTDTEMTHGGIIQTSMGTESQDDLPVIDPAKIYAPQDPYSNATSAEYATMAERQRKITARVPLKEMVGYLKHLRSLTGGRGTFVMQVDRFEKMSAQRQKVLMNEMKGYRV
jgi:elongation factor G